MTTKITNNKSQLSSNILQSQSAKVQSILLERLSGVITWAVVSGFSMVLMYNSGDFSYLHISAAAALCVLYLVIWVYSTTGDDKGPISKRKVAASVSLFFIVVAIYFFVPYSFMAIFMVIFSAVTPYYMSIKRALMLSPVWSVPLFLVYSMYWQQSGMFVTAFLFWTFNIFALVMVNTSLRERDARMQAETTNRELVATQSLLNEVVKQGERVRIARNIHDLLGHHLTALSINLQVASRKSEGEVQQNIDQCHQLAKLLLSDVREAVSDIRDKSKLDLRVSIESMLAALPNINADLDFDNNMNISDITIADTIVKCVQESITNTLKHAKGQNLSISLQYANQQSYELPTGQEQASQIALVIENDGNMPSKITLGNGLMGIQERISAIKGKVDFLLQSGKFTTRIFIPVPQHD